MSYGFSRTHRLTKTSQYFCVRENGVSIKCAPFWLQISSGGGTVPMLGIVATKRLGNAVQRNRAKRIVRELYRKHKSLFPQSSQSVIIPKRAIFKLKHSELECSFLGAIEKASIKL